MGALIGCSIITLWALHLAYLFSNSSLSLQSPISYAHLALQGYLTTGLFITAHDAMHGSVSKLKKLNHGIGVVACFLFAAMSYDNLKRNHFKHHEAPTSDLDPDFYSPSQNFFLWFGSFIWRYKSWTQILAMASFYNLFQYLLHIPESRIWLFWVLPCLWGALQLFCFGTYLPHRLPKTPDMNPHSARSQTKNHVLAMLACYFFGYHWEHHHSPKTAWWNLWKIKDEGLQFRKQ